MSNDNLPRITVIIPTCHRNDLLARCLDCLAPGIQTLPTDQYEVIVTDDGSRSTAEQMVRDSYPWVRWIEGPRLGPAANRNNGAKTAIGDFLAFIDDDCLPKLEWLAAYTAALTPNVHVYEGKTTCEAGIHSPLYQAPVNLTGGYLWSCNMMVQRSVFAALQGFDEDFPTAHMEDADFRERLKQKNFVFVFVDEALVDHPPRKVAWGQHIAATHESGVLFWYKQGHTKPFYKKLITDIIRFRLSTILRNRFCFDTLYAIASLCVELVYVSFNINSWEKKYRDHYHESS